MSKGTDFKKIIGGILFIEVLFHLFYFVLLYLLDYFSADFSNQQLLFNHPFFFIVSWFLPIFYVFYLWPLYRKSALLRKSVDTNLLPYIQQKVPEKYLIIKAILLKTIFFSLLISLAQPVFGLKKVTQNQKSLEIVLAIDVSNSMNVKDLDPEISRLEIIKRAMVQLVNSMHGEKIGICVFAGGAYVQLPVTMDYGAAKMFIHEIETDIVSNQGTNIEAALNTSYGMFSGDRTNKAIVLLTDGENHEGKIDSILPYLKQEQILLAILGVGTEQGGMIPNNIHKPELGYKMDANGKPVITRLNRQLIKKLARSSGGLAEFCSGSFPDLSNLVQKLSLKGQASNVEVEVEVKENWYQFFLLIALICLFVLALLNRSNRHQLPTN